MLKIVIEYLNFLIKSKLKHGVHSPLVYNLVEDVLLDQRHFHAFDAIEEARKHLLINKNELTVTDYGAGSKKQKSKTRVIGNIAKRATVPAKYGKLLFRLANYYKPKVLLELGTSLGIGTSYLALGKDNDAQLTTVEGDTGIFNISQQVTKALNLKNVIGINSQFDNYIADYIKLQPSIDFVYVDGNHTEEATLKYFNLLKNAMSNNGLIVFDDIYWSDGMKKAWKTIKNDDSISCTIDLFKFGLVYFRKKHAKENFYIRF